MPDSRASELLQLGDAEVDPSAWKEVENQLALVLPAFYKAAVQRFTDRHWNHFLSLLDPFSDNPYLNLLQASHTILEAERTTRTAYPEFYPLPLHPEPGGLLPWAITDNGDTLFWITRQSPASWPTLLKGPRAPEFEVFFLPTHLLIHQIAAGTIQSKILPSDL